MSDEITGVPLQSIVPIYTGIGFFDVTPAVDPLGLGTDVVETAGELKDPSIIEEMGSAVSNYFDSAMKSVSSTLGQSASNLVSPLMNQLIILLIIGLVAIYLIGKYKL